MRKLYVPVCKVSMSMRELLVPVHKLSMAMREPVCKMSMTMRKLYVPVCKLSMSMRKLLVLPEVVLLWVPTHLVLCVKQSPHPSATSGPLLLVDVAGFQPTRLV